jgi:alpha-galactosidase
LPPGRDWIRIDYGWVGPRVNGSLAANPVKFPHGMPWLIQFAHAHGIRVDLAIAWELDGTLQQLPGDMRTMINWGVDGICVLTDIGHWPTRPTVTELREIMRIAQQANLDANAVSPIGETTNRGVPLTFSVNQEPDWRVPPETAVVANSLYVQPGFNFYAAHDIADWGRKYFMPFAWFGRPGHYTHANTIRWPELQNSTNNFRLWSQVLCMTAAGFWTTTSTADNAGFLKYMTNREFNSLWFDPAGIVGHVAYSNDFTEVWVRPLGSQNSGSNLVLLLNTATNGNANVTITAGQLGVSSNTVLRVREPLDGINLTTFTGAWTYSLSQANAALFHVFPAPEAIPVVGDGRGLTNIPNSIVASGTASLAFGTNRVTTAGANVTNRVLLTYRSLNGAVAAVAFKNIEANTSFTIFSENASDTNQVDWAIVKP